MEIAKLPVRDNDVALLETVQNTKRKLEQMRMENLWIESFLQVIPRKVSTKILNPVSVRRKLELCEAETLKIERLGDKIREQDVREMKELNAATKNHEISAKDYSNIHGEFLKFVQTESDAATTSKTSVKPFISFLTNLTQTISITAASIRMNVGTMKSDVRCQELLLKKMEDLSSWLRPVDFDLLLFQKQTFLKSFDDIKKAYKGLQKDEQAVAMRKNSLRKPLFEAKSKLTQLRAEESKSRKRIQQLQLQQKASLNITEELNKSIEELKVLTSTYEAPNVINYIAKIAERDRLKCQLKIVKRKTEIVKFHFEHMMKSRKI